MNSVTLYRRKDENISIHVQAYFEGDVLVIDGYDIGKTVSEYWGDSDYEYTTRILPQGVAFLYNLFEIKPGDQLALLESLKDRYHTNFCYSEIQKLLDDKKIAYEGSSWV